MKPLTLTPELRRTAERCLWYKQPEEAVTEPELLVAHILTYGSPQDVNALLDPYTDDDLRDALDAAPPGVYDARSWAYWNLVVGRFETPPQPVRRLA